jgi:hypothetical protein
MGAKALNARHVVSLDHGMIAQRRYNGPHGSSRTVQPEDLIDSCQHLVRNLCLPHHAARNDRVRRIHRIDNSSVAEPSTNSNRVGCL